MSNTNPSGDTRFMEYAILSKTRHHYKVPPIARAPTYTDQMQLDWSCLILATITSQRGDGISVVFHELAASMEELLLEPTNFLMSSKHYQRYLDVVSMLWQNV
jgi:hypothetical protein